jgi:hypothetical protein
MLDPTIWDLPEAEEKCPPPIERYTRPQDIRGERDHQAGRMWRSAVFTVLLGAAAGGFGYAAYQDSEAGQKDILGSLSLSALFGVAAGLGGSTFLDARRRKNIADRKLRLVELRHDKYRIDQEDPVLGFAPD